MPLVRVSVSCFFTGFAESDQNSPPSRSTENSLLIGTKLEQDQVDGQMGNRGGEGERNRNRVLLLSFVVMTQRILIILFAFK